MNFSEFSTLAAGLVSTAAQMPSGHVQAFVSAVADAPGLGDSTRNAALGALQNAAYQRHVAALLEVWARLPEMSGRAFGFALMGAVHMRDRERRAESVEAVVTGPSSPHVSVRHTKAVILELVDRAQHELIMVSYAAYKVPELLAALENATRRGVKVRLILESSEDSAGALSHDAAEAFRSLREKVEFYVWPASKRPHGARLHAKGVIADGTAAFSTSANLTGHALDQNLELGVLVRGGVVPSLLAEHFRALMAAGVLQRL